MIKAIGKIVRNGQLTVPTQIRKILHIKDGDFVRFDVKDTHLIMTPVSVVDKDQSYFFSEKWQKAVKESEEAIQKGRFVKYNSAQKLKKDIVDD